MSSRIQQELDRLFKTPEFRERVALEMSRNPNFGNGSRSGSRKLAQKCADELEGFLEAEIEALESSNFKRRMSGHYHTDVVFGKDGWVVELRFDRSAAESPSLYPERYGPVYLPALFNNGWSAKGRVYGYWDTAGMVVPSHRERKATRFVENAVAAFNKKWASSGVVAKYNPEWYGMSSTTYMSEDVYRGEGA